MAPRRHSIIRAEGFNAYTNASYERAVGKDINSSQFQFDPSDLVYIALTTLSPWIISNIFRYRRARPTISVKSTRVSTDLLYGTGLRKDGATPNGDHVPGLC